MELILTILVLAGIWVLIEALPVLLGVWLSKKIDMNKEIKLPRVLRGRFGKRWVRGSHEVTLPGHEPDENTSREEQHSK